MYQIDSWGAGYFTINDAGHVAVRPRRSPAREIDLLEVVEALKGDGLHPPILVRFADTLVDRLEQLYDAFGKAIAENNYRGDYFTVFPIKVNQQRPVVEEVWRHGAPFGCGLEVGSKPELLVVLALTADAGDRLILCNGFKDDSYLEMAVLAAKMGRHVIPIVEKASELRRLLIQARKHDVRPRLGIRIRLASQGAGRWRESMGVRSKFGLAVSEVLEQFEILRKEGLEDCLELVHCHPGSQLHDIRRVKDAVAELAYFYAELVRMGAGLRYIDIGGGLGVDYDGSRTNFESSMNYGVEEYASEIVYRIAGVCEERGIAHPTIVTESGRAIAAYQSVFVFDAIGSIGLGRDTIGPTDLACADDVDTPQPICDLLEAYGSVSERRIMEAYHDAIHAREHSQQLFNLGYLTLEMRGLADRLFWATCTRIRKVLRQMTHPPEELADLETILSEIYICNFSLFQSLPDSWAIDQLFPIMPIHRLDEKPTHRAVLADITCDSDGKVDRFVDVRDINRTLPLHELRQGEPYYIATFLVGAYQETLGGLHNLFGDVNVAHIALDDGDGWRVEEIVHGDTVGDVVSYVQYKPKDLDERMQAACARAERDGTLTAAKSREVLALFRSQLASSTYLTDHAAD